MKLQLNLYQDRKSQLWLIGRFARPRKELVLEGKQVWGFLPSCRLKRSVSNWDRLKIGGDSRLFFAELLHRNRFVRRFMKHPLHLFAKLALTGYSFFWVVIAMIAITKFKIIGHHRSPQYFSLAGIDTYVSIWLTHSRKNPRACQTLNPTFFSFYP